MKRIFLPQDKQTYLNKICLTVSLKFGSGLQIWRPKTDKIKVNVGY